MTDAILDPLISFCVDVIGEISYPGIVVLMLLERHKVFQMNQKHLGTADRWFVRHGEAAVFFTRLLPMVRTFISLPAGVARMPYGRFTLFTVLGCIPWVLALGYLGTLAGENWREWKDYLHYFDYVAAAAIIGGVAWLIVRWRRNRIDGDSGDQTATAKAGTGS